MLLHDSRRAARIRDGAIVPLAEQDRTQWDVEQIAQGRALLDRALGRGARGPYALQAAIAELQTHDPVDWPSVAELYDALLRETGSAVVALNRAVAVAEVEGPAAALAIVDDLDSRRLPLPALHPRRAPPPPRPTGTPPGPPTTSAFELATTDPERRFLERRRREL